MSVGKVPVRPVEPGPTSYVQGNHDNHQAPSHWNTSMEVKYLPCTYLREGWAGSKAFESNVNVQQHDMTWLQQENCKLPSLPVEPTERPASRRVTAGQQLFRV